ncbi:MAG: hypothetical protein ACTSRZ_07360 [Promethearchaeota archaeon]
MKKTLKRLERIRFNYLNTPIELRAMKNFNRTIMILNKKIGPFLVGNHYHLEFWIAKPFIEREILQPTEEYKIDLQLIQKFAFNESRSRELKKLPESFYIAVKEYLTILSKQTNLNYSYKKRFRDVYSNTLDLITVRQRKILNLSQMKNTSKYYQNLTPEEKVLIENINNDLSNWRKFFLEDLRKIYEAK